MYKMLEVVYLIIRFLINGGILKYGNYSGHPSQKGVAS
jgi:hypothetical protein